MDTYEKKYKEALAHAREIHRNEDEKRRDMEWLFPELKESEDERIMKKILFSLQKDIMATKNSGCNTKDLEECIAWLENQGDIDKTSYEIAEKEKREFVGGGFIKCYADFQDFKEGETYWLEYIGNDNYNVRSDNLLGKTYHITPCQLYTIFKKQTWLEKKGEQKPVDKVEPKFEIKKGRWYVCDTPRYTDFIVGKAYYCPKNGMLKPNENEMARYVARNCFHLWTIEDAKDGDVLVDVYGNIGIFEQCDDFDWVSYCSLGHNGGFQHFKIEHENENTYPATKEERDLLFQKMKEAGYEWDAERKELKRIEQKQEWSEEDEDILKTCFYFFNGGKGGISDNKKERILNWLKSLRPQNQWKPSDKQLEALKEACDKHWEPDGLDQLYTLYQYLKKLRDE